MKTHRLATVLTLVISGTLGLGIGLAPVAQASEIVCGLADEGVIHVDGLLQDWKGVPAYQKNVGARGDSGIFLKCNYSATKLYISVYVTDDHIVRSNKGARTEDNIEFRFGKKSLTVWPALSERKIPRKVAWTGRGPASRLAIADSLQKKGFSVELGIPLSRLPNWGKGTPAVPFAVKFRDADLLSASRTQTIVDTGSGRLTFQAAAETFKWFLSQNKLRARDVRVDKLVEMDGERGLERVVVARNIVGVFSEQFTYIQLPAKNNKDIREIRIIDLAGQGKSSILARYMERGSGGSREVLVVYNILENGSFGRTFAHELSKKMGRFSMKNTWSLRPRKKKRKRLGYELVIKAGATVGFTEENFREIPADDLLPIIRPWAEATEEVFWFKDDEVFGG